jgi:uncharacterized protein (TIGR00661 family)
MKIFYAIQATGNGHISRAVQLYPYLKKFGTVDFFMSGNNASLNVDIPIKYKSKGCSLHYSKCGGLDYWEIAKNIKPLQMYRDAKALPLSDYDVVINDFDSITSLACRLQKVKSVQFGHQASFMSDLTPRPEKNNIMGELVLKHYAPAPKYIGLHFKKYDSFIHPPIIKDEIFLATPKDLNHISVYLPSFDRECLEKAFHKVKGIEFQWFLNDIKEIRKEGNITYFPVNQKLFNESLINCHGILTGGGFETPAEALFLNKKILSIPIKNHYEQECNAAALKLLGVPVLNKVGDDFHIEIENWLNGKIIYPKIEANDIPKTVQYLFDTYND